MGFPIGGLKLLPPTVNNLFRGIPFSQEDEKHEHILESLLLGKFAWCEGEGEGEGEVAFFSAKRWDRRNRVDLIESATPCHDAQVVGPYRDSNSLRLTVLAAMSEDYTTAPQHLQCLSLNFAGFRKGLSAENLLFHWEGMSN